MGGSHPWVADQRDTVSRGKGEGPGQLCPPLTGDSETSSIWCFSLPCTRSWRRWDISEVSGECASTTQSVGGRMGKPGLSGGLDAGPPLALCL